ncbi:MAG: DUF6262 family protein [Streptosporangiaceae bacterium]
MTGNSLTASQRRSAALRLAAQSKRQAAVARADTGIRQLIKDNEQINFRSVARTAGVSIDFLYANTGLRQRIEKLRARETAARLPDPRPPATGDDSDLVHSLTVKLREERAARRSAVADLEEQLAAAHGQLLRLRRLLQQRGASS